MMDVIGFWDDECQAYDFDTNPESRFSLKAFFAVTFVWVVCFLCVFQGVKSSSYIVWITVPVPVVFVIIMVFKGLSLEGAEDGIKQYLQGNQDRYAGMNETAKAEAEAEYEETMATVWSEAAGQIFFSIGVCMGIMTSYGSYNPVRKPIIMDNMIIAFSNSGLSFIAGFAVWSVVGYLQNLNSIAKSKTSSIGLAFIAYPTAIDNMNMPNLWAIILGLTLFLLGIDSAFSFIEAASTVICDTQFGSRFPRMFVAFVLCIFGWLLAIPFCTNWGFILFDVIDHYMGNSLLIIVGILQCMGCGWGFDVANIVEKSPQHKKAIIAHTLSFWFCLAVLGIVFVSIENVTLGLIVNVIVDLFLVCPLSFYVSGLPIGEWYDDVLMTGVKKIGYSMTVLGRKDENQRQWWEPAFVFYWGFCIKYLIPTVLYYMLVNFFKIRIEKPYEGYPGLFQVIGILVPAIALSVMIVFMFVNVYEEPFDKEQFEEHFN